MLIWTSHVSNAPEPHEAGAYHMNYTALGIGTVPLSKVQRSGLRLSCAFLNDWPVHNAYIQRFQGFFFFKKKKCRFMLAIYYSMALGK